MHWGSQGAPHRGQGPEVPDSSDFHSEQVEPPREEQTQADFPQDPPGSLLAQRGPGARQEADLRERVVSVGWGAEAFVPPEYGANRKERIGARYWI